MGDANINTAPSTVASETNVDQDGLISTEPVFVDEPEADTTPVDTTSEQTIKPAKVEPSGTAEQNTDKTTKATITETEQETAEKKDSLPSLKQEKDIPFHEHPRFKELITEKNQAKERVQQLEQEMQVLKQAKEDGGEKAFLDLSSMSEDEILDKFNENPKEFLSEFANKITTGLKTQLTAEQQEKTQQQQDLQAQTELEQYFTANEDALKMWQAGDIQHYMQEHPAYNPIAAHMALTEKNRIEQVTEQKLQAERLKWEKELKAKGRATSTSTTNSAPAQRTKGVDKRLQNSNKNGGIVNVLKTLWEEREAAV